MLKINLGCVVSTPDGIPEDPINCIKDISLVNYGSAFLYADFERNGDRWYFFGPSWNQGERKINEETKNLSKY